MSTREYNRKRDFRRTPEPRSVERAGSPGRSSGAPIFVIQKHDASRLHYDLRLEINGSLASWAVPKGPSLDPADKRLAVHVEDHPLDYADFEGVITPKQYGAGPVIVWDRGTWEPEAGDAAGAVKKGKLSFRLFGEKLSGGWTLARMNGRRREGAENWLLIKQDDEAARRHGQSITDQEPRSVETGRTIEEVARGRAPTPAGDAPDAAAVAGARKATMPKEISPALCTLADAAPEGEDWLHEIKFDGYRILARKDGARVRLVSRNQNDWSERLRPIAQALASLAVDRAIIDGEAAIVDEHGVTSFQRLQQSIKERRFERLVFYAFDLPYLSGHDLTGAPLRERKRALRALLGGAATGPIRYSDHVVGNGPSVRENACRMGLEGIVSKRADAPYAQARSTAWLKVRCANRQEFVVVGWTPPSGSRRHFGALLLGVHDAEGRLVYAGRVGTGFTDATLKDLKGRLDRLSRNTCPLSTPPPRREGKDARWVTPRMVAEITFTQWTEDGRLRHPSFQGLREDKRAEEVVVERATPEPRAAREPDHKTGSAPRARAGHGTIAGVRLTSVDRVLYPDQGLTKLDLAEHYERVADQMLPLVSGRPLSLVRCPEGRAKECFFQKHPGQTFGSTLRRIMVSEKSAKREYVVVDDLPGLVTLVQFGVLEIHPWGSHESDLERPDRLVFDLDPGEGATLDQIKDGAALVRDRLESHGLRSFLLATGGHGLHVVAPIKPDAKWDDAKAFCKAIATRIAREDPTRYVAVSTKSKRKNRVFVDYLRNGRGATAVAPYSTRARPHAPVATPLAWDELPTLRSFAQHTVATFASRLDALESDPWDGYRRTRQRLTRKRLLDVLGDDASHDDS